jgi:hypothetical protein
MSIEKKIAEMLAESNQLKTALSEETQEPSNKKNDVREPSAPTTKKGDVKSNASAPESSNLKAVKEENEENIDESVDVGDSDEAEENHHDHAMNTKPTHEWKEKNGTHHKVWHTTHEGAKSTLMHTSEPGASSAPVMRLEEPGHHSVAAIKKSQKEYNEEVEVKAREFTIDVSEDVAALVNGEELTEEFKTKAATIFEAAVVTRVKQEIVKLDEEYESKLAEQVENYKEGLVEKIDGYLNYMVEQWIADNELALESGIKSEIMEDFIEKLKVAFQESYIEIPEERFDVLADMEETLQSLESKLDETVAKNIELTKTINESARKATVDAFVKDMTDTEVEKFKSLSEELSYDDAESFKKKLQTIHENYFAKKASSEVKSVVTDSAVEELREEKVIDPNVKAYLNAFNTKK